MKRSFRFLLVMPPAFCRQNLSTVRSRQAVGFISALLFSGVFSTCAAQGYLEGVNVSNELMPMEVKNSTVDHAFYGNNLRINDFIPVFLKKDKSEYLVFGLNLESLNFTGTHPDFPVTGIYSISPVLGYSRRINSQLNLSALLIPLLNSDLEEVQSSDIHFGGVIRGAYHISENFAVKLTVGYRKQYYGPQYIVLVGLDWKLSDKWRLFGEMPTYATLSYSLTPKMNAGASYLSGNTSYRLSAQDHYLQYLFAQPGLFIEYYITPIIALRTTVAYAVERNMDIYNMSDKINGGVIDHIDLGPKTTPLNMEVATGPAFKLSLSLRVPEPKNK